MHVRRHDEEPKGPVEPEGELQVAVAEHGRRVQDDLEEDHRHGGGAEKVDEPQLDRHGEDDLERVEADPRGEVEVEIGVVDHVQAPQRRQVVEEDVLHVDEEVEEHDADHDGCPVGDLKIVQQPPPFTAAQQGEARGENGEEETDDQGVQRHNPQVGEPPCRLGGRQGPSRRDPLQDGQDGEGPQEEGQADCCFIFQVAIPWFFGCPRRRVTDSKLGRWEVRKLGI